VGADKDWEAVSMTDATAAAIKTDGSLWCWGANFEGRVGVGSDAVGRYFTPVQAGADKDWVTVDGSGWGIFFAVKADGSLWAWGNNINHSMGTGEADADQHSPTQIGADRDWISAHHPYSPHSVGIKYDGSVWVWGWNNFRVLGNGEDTPSIARPYPTMVGTDTDWAYVSSAWSHILAVKADGSLWTWGYCAEGSLGTLADDGQSLTVPTRVGEAKDWVAVGGGVYDSLALKADGSLYTWGTNASGQIGNGTTDRQLTHFKVGEGFRVPAKR
jgi:alpha-tubulin suppressor-like RCC1 family protein